MPESRSRPVPDSMRSADHTLRAAGILQAEGSIGVTELSRRLGVSLASAHRILTALVYRDFALPGPGRRYYPGPLLRSDPDEQRLAVRLRRYALPHLVALSGRTGLTSHLLVLSGRYIRFLASVEGPNGQGSEGREGTMFPAELALAGRLLLAEQGAGEVAARYRDAPAQAPEPDDLRRLLGEYIQQGYLIQETLEPGVAIGVPVRTRGIAVAGLAVSAASERFDDHDVPGYVQDLQAAATALESDLTQPDA